jgi:hypothetical protein
LVAATIRTSAILRRAHRPEGALLQHAQQLHLHRRGHLAHLVEEERSRVGLLEQAPARRDGAGERAARVPEHLALQQLVREGAAVDGQEAAAARGALVQRLGDQLLPGARLARDEDGAAGRRDALDDAEDGLHALVGPDDGGTPAVAQARAQAQVLLARPLQLDGVGDAPQELVGVERAALLDVVEGAALDGVDRVAQLLRNRRHHDDGDLRQVLSHVLQHAVAVEPRHRDVGHHHVEGLRAELLDGLAPVARRHDLGARVAQQIGEHVAEALVVHHEQARALERPRLAALGARIAHAAPPAATAGVPAGSLTSTRVPAPRALSMRMRPP